MKQKSQCTAAEEAIEMYSEMVYRLAYARVRNTSDADDIFQEVFLRYIRKNPNFENEEHRKAWLIKVTVNCSKKHFSSSWFKKTESLDEKIVFEEPDEISLDEMLCKLGEKYRIVLHLFYYEGYSTDEIARILGEKPSTVRSQLTRARNKLKGELQNNEFDI